MITLTPLKTDSENWKDFIALYLHSFPPDERREVDELIRIQGAEAYSLYQITSYDLFLGFIEIWHFDEFTFLEHIAILNEEQQKGYGSDVLRMLLLKSEKPILLEVEPATDIVSSKRISFYLKLGFIKLDIDYSQPPYYAGKHSVPMLLLSNMRLPEKVILEYISKIRDSVYKI